MQNQNLPPDVYEKIQKGIQRPEGTVQLDYISEDLFDPEVPGGIISQIPAGGHLIRLERTDDLKLCFYHSSPGTGTRRAVVDLAQMPPSHRISLVFTWTPDEIRLHVRPLVDDAEVYSAQGAEADRQFRVGRDGSVIQVGDGQAEVKGVNVYQEGEAVLQPTAIESWNNTVFAIETLESEVGDDIGSMPETIVTSLTLVMLVTGLETYARRRFVELEEEGIQPDTEALVERFFPQPERDQGILTALRQEAQEQGLSLLSHIVNRRAINFQDYNQLKRAYKCTYGIRLGLTKVSSQTLESVQDYLEYRHRVVHISPMTAVLNQPEVPPEDPVFASRDLAQQAKGDFDSLVQSLHQATLDLRPNDADTDPL